MRGALLWPGQARASVAGAHLWRPAARCRWGAVPLSLPRLRSMPRQVTIATALAGRGTDILLGGNPKGLVQMLLENRLLERLAGPGAALDRAPCRLLVLQICAKHRCCRANGCWGLVGQGALTAASGRCWLRLPPLATC